MKKLKCLIVDDERLARQNLRRLLEARGDIVIAGEASNKTDAVRAVSELHPDLLLLDIQMPHGDGFDVMNALENAPHVIFVTAHDKHALRAFEVNALGYLLKPVDPGRFNQAIDRAVQFIRAGKAIEAREPESVEATDVALIELGASGHFVTVDQILAVEAEGNYTRVTTADGKHTTARQPMKQWTGRLPQEMFVQLDRGLIINRLRIRSTMLSARMARITLGNCHYEIQLGPAATARLRELMTR